MGRGKKSLLRYGALKYKKYGRIARKTGPCKFGCLPLDWLPIRLLRAIVSVMVTIASSNRIGTGHCPFPPPTILHDYCQKHFRATFLTFPPPALVYLCLMPLLWQEHLPIYEKTPTPYFGCLVDAIAYDGTAAALRKPRQHDLLLPRCLCGM
jgi:hypothetical protein